MRSIDRLLRIDGSPILKSMTSASPQAHHPKGTALVVDDHPVNRLLMETMLVKEGWSVAQADSAGQAMALLKGGLRPQVIFMDIRMPVCDGLTASRHIRQWEASQHLPPVPIIALTADHTDEICTKAAEAGMSGFMTKPVSLSDIRATLTSLCPT